MKRVAAASLLVASIVPLSASARVAADDLSIHLGYSALVTKAGQQGSTETLRFEMQPVLSWDGGEPLTVRIVFTNPPGTHWGRRRPGAADGCITTAAQAVCTKRVTSTPGTNLAATFGIWDVVAERPGRYTFTGTIAESGRPDPDTSNNADSLTLDVKNVVTGVTLRPARPTAGSTIVAAHPVWSRSSDQVFPLSTGSVSCTASVGGVRITARPALTNGRASCTVRTRPGARGKTLGGTIRTASGGLRLTKSYSARLR